ncbi:MAG: DUF2344 domain-containing protein [Elusimicrobia bacterium]|nr:DUF2344 domain-containing protein [Elusimicrobiota bacterium]
MAEARVFSHLEQIHLLKNWIKKAHFPEPFRLSFGPAISVGYESLAEYVDLQLCRWMKPEEVFQKLQAILPSGYSMLELRRIPRFFPSLEEVLNVVDYEVWGRFGIDAEKPISKLLAKEHIFVEKMKPGGRREQIDLRTLLIKMFWERDHLRLILRFGPKKTVKPETVVSLWIEQGSQFPFRVLRKNLFSETASGELLLP